MCRLVGDGRYVPRMQHSIAARMSDSMGDISLRSAASAAALVSAENSFSSAASDTDARDKSAQPQERGGLLSVSSVGSVGSVGSASGGLTVGVPSPVSVDGFEPTNLADSDEEPEEGAGSVAGPEKTELAAERAGDWVRPPHCDYRGHFFASDALPRMCTGRLG